VGWKVAQIEKVSKVCRVLRFVEVFMGFLKALLSIAFGGRKFQR
jgi:hypothetical protein